MTTDENQVNASSLELPHAQVNPEADKTQWNLILCAVCLLLCSLFVCFYIHIRRLRRRGLNLNSIFRRNSSRDFEINYGIMEIYGALTEEEKLKIIDRELIKRSGTYIEQAEMNMFPSDDSLKEMADGQAEMLRNDKCSDDSSPCCCICLEEYDESSIVTRPKVRYISIHFDAVYNSIS